MTIEVKIICDSINKYNVRLTTFILKYPRYIHSEMQTHRMFSRNCSSTRAIPLEKAIQDVKDNPVIPIYWGKNKPGMQAAEELLDGEKELALKEWLNARDNAIKHVENLLRLGLHKQISGRILEPWNHITSICSATDFNNFYNLRRNKDAQPEIHELADRMYEEQQKNVPVFLDKEWHIPFIKEEENNLDNDTKLKISVARCARVSYNNHDGTKTNVLKDIELHDKLVVSRHWSPFEHQAISCNKTNKKNLYCGNFKTWIQYRKYFKNENII